MVNVITKKNVYIKQPIETVKDLPSNNIITKNITGKNKLVIESNNNDNDNIILKKPISKVVEITKPNTLETLVRKNITTEKPVIIEKEKVKYVNKPIEIIKDREKSDIIINNILNEKIIEKPVENTIIKEIRIKNKKNIPGIYSF